MEFDIESMKTLRRRTNTVRGSSAETRRKAEKKASISETDGRRLRRTGRTVQLNIKVKPEFKKQLQRLSKSNKVGMAEMLEIVLEQWADEQQGDE